jgi:hypothetical protein
MRSAPDWCPGKTMNVLGWARIASYSCRASRVALHVFRATNQEIARVEHELGSDGSLLEVVCECGRDDCAELITVSESVYEQTRSAPRRFLLVAGHELPEIERVVNRYNGFVVGEKEAPAAAATAEETDPRQ